MWMSGDSVKNKWIVKPPQNLLQASLGWTIEEGEEVAILQLFLAS